MNLPHKPRQSEDERKAAILKAHEESQKIFKLVVKVIRWETEISGGDKNIEKITHDEWNKYTKHLLGIYQLDNQQRAKDKLKKTYLAIKDNGGFR